MSCILYLVRHAIADDESPTGSDADRALSEDGVRKMRRAALGLKRLGVEPDVILSSPLRRAEETAALLVEVLAPELGVEIYPPLAPGNAVAEIINGLRAHRGARHLALVGHQPDLGQLASHLLTGSATVAQLPFKKGAIAAIQVAALPPRGVGALEWFVTSKQLRAMAE